MRLNRMLALGASLLVLLSACGTGGGSKPTVKVGSDGFYEAKLLAEIYAQALEANSYTIDRTGIGLGSRKVTAPALESGQIDLKPEYIGTGLAFYDATKISNDPAAEATALQAILNTKGGGITLLPYSTAADQNAFVVRPDTATSLNLKTLSDAAAIQDKVKWGFATDCPTNPVCGAPGGALQAKYGLKPETIANATLLSACDQPMVDAIANKTVDVGELCTSQPDIPHNGWIILTDDKNTQPAENIAPLVRNDYLAKVDKAAFSKILNDVSAKLDTATLLQLNTQIVFDKKDVKDVATGWLKANGFVK